MSAETRIEWCDSTFNPWIGCTKVSPACDHCYAAVSTPARALGVVWGPGQTRRRTAAANWRQPQRWNAQPFVECPACRWRGEAREMHWGDTCPGAGCFGKPQPTRRRVFCASLADVFDNEVDPQWRADLLALIDSTPNLDWLLLTKRIGNVTRMLTDLRDSEATSYFWSRLNDWITGRDPWPNVWLGATICNQAEANRDIPKLLAAPAAVRFLSMEPLLGPVNFRWTPYAHQATNETYRKYLDRNGKINHLEALGMIDWVIAGGESGQHARPLRADWIRSLRDQCAAADVAFLFKQWGEFLPADANEADPCLPEAKLYWSDGAPWDRLDGQRGGVELVARVGKKAAGRLLDGIEHNGWPATGRA